MGKRELLDVPLCLASPVHRRAVGLEVKVLASRLGSALGGGSPARSSNHHNCGGVVAGEVCAASQWLPQRK